MWLTSAELIHNNWNPNHNIIQILTKSFCCRFLHWRTHFYFCWTYVGERRENDVFLWWCVEVRWWATDDKERKGASQQERTLWERGRKKTDGHGQRDRKEWGNMKTNTVKREHHSLASRGLKLPPTALERQRINPRFQPGFVSLHRKNMAWNPIIPGCRDTRAPSSSLIPRLRHHLHCIYIYIYIS